MISFDQSSSVTGYAVFEDGKYIRSGTIDLSMNHDAKSRLKSMMMLINGMICSTGASRVVIEDIQQQTNSSTYKMLAQLQGAIMYYCYENQIKFSTIAPVSWRKRLGFEQGRKVRRYALKLQSVKYVSEHLGKKVNDDEADAICVGLATRDD